MTEEEIEKQHVVDHALANSRDRRTHRWLTAFRLGLVLCILALGVLVLLLFLRMDAKDKDTLALIRQVQAQCDSGAFRGSICGTADDLEKDVKSDPVVVPVAGRDGADGKDGSDGKDGKPGSDGSDGADGTDGSDGADGTDGVNGLNGMSAYEIAVAQGFQGTQEEWVASLRGKDGTNGTDGADGADGDDAWPFQFSYTFTNRAGQTWTCTIEIGENGVQTNQPAQCTSEDPLPEQPQN